LGSLLRAIVIPPNEGDCNLKIIIIIIIIIFNIKLRKNRELSD
jgi:hypothetical protein